MVISAYDPTPIRIQRDLRFNLFSYTRPPPLFQYFGPYHLMLAEGFTSAMLRTSLAGMRSILRYLSLATLLSAIQVLDLFLARCKGSYKLLDPIVRVLIHQTISDHPMSASHSSFRTRPQNVSKHFHLYRCSLIAYSTLWHTVHYTFSARRSVLHLASWSHQPDS